MAAYAQCCERSTDFIGSTNLEVTVPFSFVAGHSTPPAGQYEISIDDNKHLICIKGSGASPSMALFKPTDRGADGSRGLESSV
jgi:hypothetical protein